MSRIAKSNHDLGTDFVQTDFTVLEETEKAFRIGFKACEDNKSNIPAQSADLMKMIKPGTPVGGGMHILDGFINGWDSKRRIDMKKQFGF